MEVSCNDAIDKAVAALKDQQQGDGSWPGTNFAGPMYTAMTLVVEHYVGVLEEHDAREAVRWMCTTQLDDGSFPSYPFAERGQLGATGMVYAAFVATHAEDLVPEAMQRAKAFLDQNGGFGPGVMDPQTRIYLALAGIVDPLTLDKPQLLFKLIPGVDRMLGRRFGLAMVLIANQNSMIVRGLQVGAGRTNPWRHPLRALENWRVFRYLTTHQNPEGNWAGVIMPTLAGILCFHFLGVPRTDPRLRNALQYLKKWKTYRDSGLEVMPTLGVIWNTALVTRALMLAGSQDEEAQSIQRGLEYLLQQQSDMPMPADWQNPDRGQPRTGGWNYYSDNKLCCDADTTGAVLWTLGLALETGTIPEQHARGAAQRGIAWELGMQNADGGWPAFAHGQTSKPPGPMYEKPLAFPKANLMTMLRLFLNPPATLADPATEGLTGRVLCGLAHMGHDSDSDEVREAIRFLKSQQWSNGAWWGRWEVNFLMASGCVLTGLKAVGEDMATPYVQKAARWMLSRQNDDGGWGESIESYSDPENKAGVGPSQSIITGAVVSALIDAGQGHSEAVRRGIEYIVSKQNPQGLWDEKQCYYVILPPDYYYTNFYYSQYLPLEALVKYRAVGAVSA